MLRTPAAAGAARTRERGLLDVMASARVGLADDVALDIDAHAFRMARAFPTSSERLLGGELDLTLPVSLGTGQALQLDTACSATARRRR